MNKINKRFTLIIGVIILIFIMALFVIKAKKRLALAPVYKLRPVVVKVAKVKKRNVELKMHYLARLISDVTSDICPKINAQIIKIYHDEGDFVKKNEILCQLYNKDIVDKMEEINAKIEEIKSKIRAVKSEILAAKSDYEYIKMEYIRAKKLYKGKAVSKSYLDQSKARYEVSKQKVISLEQNYKALQHALDGAYASLKQTKVLLSYTIIRAPYDGIVSQRFQDLGDMATISKPIFEMYSPNKIKLVFSVVQEDVNKIRPGIDVKISWPKEYRTKGLPKVAKVTKVYPSLIQGKATVAEAYLGTLPCSVKIGSFIPIDAIVDKKLGLAIPTSGIIPIKGNSKGVYLVKNNKLELVKVDILLSSPEYTIIRGRVKEGDLVVIGDYLKWTQLSPKMEVRAVL